jgi:hypothetical protein
MPRHVFIEAPGLLTRVQHALGATQKEVATLLGLSRRTIIRYAQGSGRQLSIREWTTLARAVHARNRAVAEEIAREIGETLVSLGIEPPPVPPPPPPPPPARRQPSMHDLGDVVVCAAAEAAGVEPGIMRPALTKAVERAAALGMSMDELRTALTPKKRAARKS